MEKTAGQAQSSVVSVVLIIAVLIVSFSIGALGIVDFFDRSESSVESEVTYRENYTGVFVVVADVDNSIQLYSDGALVEEFSSGERGSEVFVPLSEKKNLTAEAQTDNKKLVISRKRFGS